MCVYMYVEDYRVICWLIDVMLIDLALECRMCWMWDLFKYESNNETVCRKSISETNADCMRLNDSVIDDESIEISEFSSVGM